MANDKLREALVEELCDVLMYFNDSLLCYGITPAEISIAYARKHHKNMERDFSAESNAYLID